MTKVLSLEVCHLTFCSMEYDIGFLLQKTNGFATIVSLQRCAIVKRWVSHVFYYITVTDKNELTIAEALSWITR